jgi:hypothetical protein
MQKGYGLNFSEEEVSLKIGIKRRKKEKDGS